MANSLRSETLPRRRTQAHPEEIGAFELRIVNTLDELDQLRESWRALFSPTDPPFSSFSWNRAWYRSHLEFYDEMLLFVAKRDRSVVAILPAYRKGTELRLAGDNVCDYQDVIANDGAVIPALLKSLFQFASEKKLDLNFARISSIGNLSKQLIPAAGKSGFLYSTRLIGPCPYLQLPDNLEKLFTDRFSNNRRSQIRRSLKRIRREIPDLEHRLLRGDEMTSETIAEIAELHLRNQHRKSGRSIFAGKRFRNFLADLAGSDSTSEAGLSVSILKGDQKIIAMILGMSLEGRFYYWIPAFEGSFARLRPGACSLIFLMENLIESGHTEFDFLCGAELYKFDYADLEYEIRGFEFLRPTLRNRIRRLSWRIGRWLRHILKHALIRLRFYRPNYRLNPGPR